MLFSLPENRVSTDLEILVKNNLTSSGNYLKKMESFYANNFHNEILEDFLLSFVRKEILLRHKIVALNKLGKGTRSTLKFFTEGDKILYESNFSPSLTNPRIGTLFTMLTDLKILLQKDSDSYLLNPEYFD